MVAVLDTSLALRVMKEARLTGDEDEVVFGSLGGGVSSIVLLAQTPRGRFVLKQPRERFQVRDEWIVDARRIGVEVEFVRAVGPLLPPGSVMGVRAYDEADRVAVFDAAPAGWSSWKERLLAGRVEPSLAQWAGDTLARIHEAGRTPALYGRFQNTELFDQQRLDPYYRTAASRAPEVAGALHALIKEATRGGDLVHGDFSPKNLLTDGERMVAIDHEVATRGDAAFDVAFLVNHLLLKLVHVPERREALAASARAAWEAYARRCGVDEERDKRVLRHLGGLQLARAIGKSPAEYLSEEERGLVRAFGTGLLQRPAESLDEALDRLTQTVSEASGHRR